MEILKVKTEKRKLGNLGEKLARRQLKKEGYKILKKNYVAEGAEIDIIAKKRDTVVFVEVKTRSFKEGAVSSPASAVTPEKQRKIIKAAKSYAAFCARDCILRLDVIEVIIDGKRKKEINHIENAFNYNTSRG